MGSIAESAVLPITRESYPRTYAAWGDEGVRRINELMQPAAEIVASSPGCDRLESLVLSEQRSAPPDNIVFFADCANGVRFFITEEEVLAGRQSISQNDKSKWLDEQQLVEICREAINARVGGSCRFGPADVYRAVAGRTVITLDFSSGAESNGTARRAKCYFDGLSLTAVDFLPV